MQGIRERGAGESGQDSLLVGEPVLAAYEKFGSNNKVPIEERSFPRRLELHTRIC